MERPRLLLADDSLTIQRVVNLTFAEEGIDVVTAGDGDSALREIANKQPDIVLADVHMPGPSGYEICSLLRGIEETAKIPVILLVGSFEQFDPEEADRVGANAFVTKPFQSIRELIDQVKELLPSPAEPATEDNPVVYADSSVVPKEVDTTDIDTLYEQSFAETVEIPADVAAEYAASVSSDRLDDEMIETSYLSAQPDERVEVEPAFVDAGEYTQVAEVSEPGFGDHPQRPEEGDRDAGGSYYETLQMDSPPAAVLNHPNTDSAMHTAPTEELHHRDPFATTTDAFDLDDIDLLDLSPSQVDEKFSFGTPTQSVEAGSSKQVVSISPELLDIIVRKVVEKLSEKY